MRRFAFASALLLIGFAGKLSPSARRAEVVFFDVGQGDAALVRFADGHTALVDTGGGGGAADVGRRTLVRELARENVLRPDLLVLSHSDTDHAFGAFGLLESMTVGTLWMHAGEHASRRPLVAALEAFAALRRVPLRLATAPRRLAFGEDSIVLSPVSTAEGRNGMQLGADVRLGPCRFVLLGDMTEAGESRWLSANVGQADVLKVSHHGSRTSSAPALLDVLRPRWAVVSSGADNRYGHPTAEALDRFRARRIDLLRTDFHGAVRFTVDPDGVVHCETADGSCGRRRCVTSGLSPELPVPATPLSAKAADP